VLLPAVTLYLGILNNRSWMFALCAAEILLFVVQAVFVLYQAEHLETKVQMPSGIVSERDNVKVLLKIKNTGFLPATRVQAVLGVRACGEKNYKIAHLTGEIEAFNTRDFIITVGMLSPSLYELWFIALEVYDYLGLFSKRLDFYRDADIAVLPDIVCLPVFWEGGEIPIDGEADDSRKGQDYSEISDIREYRPGDNLRQIYWKLSAGSEKLLVREGSAGRGVSAVVHVQIPQYKNSLPFIAKIAVSYMHSLLLQKKLFYVSFGEPPQRFLVRDREDLYLALLSFYEVCRETMDSASVKRKGVKRRKGWVKNRKTRGKEKESEELKGRRKKKNPKKRYYDNWQEEVSLSYRRLFSGEPCPLECWIYEGNQYFILQEPGGIKRRYLAHRYIKGSHQEWEQLESELRENKNEKRA